MGASRVETGASHAGSLVTEERGSVVDEALQRAEKEAIQTGTLRPLVKLELKYFVQTRRSQQGLEAIEVDNSVKPSYPLTEEEVRKREARAKSNRNSARKSRLRRKENDALMLQELGQEKKKRVKLNEKLKWLTKEIQLSTQRLQAEGFTIEQLNTAVQARIRARAVTELGLQSSPGRSESLSVSEDSQWSSTSGSVASDSVHNLALESPPAEINVDQPRLVDVSKDSSQQSPGCDTIVIEQDPTRFIQELEEALRSHGVTVQFEELVQTDSQAAGGQACRSRSVQLPSGMTVSDNRCSQKPGPSSNPALCLPVFQGLLSDSEMECSD